ncbi:MAG: DUF885 domain-containing protein [Proteobacteria bacterium]|nr:DUF885 domain-containing protein [Pseudomonadota bacterium]
MKIKLIAILISILFVSCTQEKTNNITMPESHTLYNNATIALFKARPISATRFGMQENLAGGKFNHKLADFSPVAEQKFRQALRDINQQLGSTQSTQDDVNKEVMQNLIRYFAGNENFKIGYIDTWMGLSAFIVNQINGPLINVPNTMITGQQINSLADAQDYIKRLDDFDIFVAKVLAKMTADADEKWLPPLVIINKSIAAMQDFIKPDPSVHPFVTSFAEKLQKSSAISSQQKQQMLAKVKIIVQRKVYPAYNNVISALNDLTKYASNNSGIWAQPNGVEFYQDAVKMLGDTNLTPAQIHQLGLDEVTRISTEMDGILIAQGLTQGSVGQRMMAINADEQFLYEDSDAGREQLLQDLNGYIHEISQRMDEQFATRPKYAVEVRKFPKAREASAPGGMYTNPPLDGSKPGIYWINLRDIKANPKFDLKTLTYHEAMPGHHWQIALNLEQESLPMLRRMAPYNAYIEGWALYSEKVAAEMGMYKNDPYSDLGRLKAELFRAVRLVVDTGLHYKKWSREQAIKYMAETTGTVESDVVAEIERYMIWPAQALGYKLGMINILKLRADARKQLGDNFDIKEFHDLVLLGGAVPMTILNHRVAQWITQRKS